ncbi:hypothetical protein Hdeb2414_s0053g00753471 [Helianthus debilis subsp. tardiflorus]
MVSIIQRRERDNTEIRLRFSCFQIQPSNRVSMDAYFERSLNLRERNKDRTGVLV